MDKEIRGIYNVTLNDKKATPILKDIEAIEDVAIEYIAMYMKGFHNLDRDRGLGAEHIKLHLEKGSKGEISIEELVNIGHSLRAYLKEFREPFTDERNAKIYEWENDRGIRFRVITDIQRGGPQLPLSPSEHQIISFYSDRNLNERMTFKNPQVKAYYENLEHTSPANEHKESLKDRISKLDLSKYSKANINNKDKGFKR